MSVDTILEELNNNPLYHLFIASKELFHSNFWFWLSQKNKNELYKVFSGKYPINDVVFRREERKSKDNRKARIDLIIRNDGSPEIIIENKVKDIVKKEQLDLIEYVFSGENVEYILVTLKEGESNQRNNWKVLTYKELHKRIIPEKYSNDEFEINLIGYYKDLIYNLDCLVKQFNTQNEYEFFISDNINLYNKLNEFKLWEMFQKIQGSNMYNYFRERMSNDVILGYGVNNQKLTFDIKIEISAHCFLGVQIEDNQYRKLIEKENAEESIEKLIEANIYFNPTWKSPHKKRFLKYGTTFKYQYERIEKISFKDLLKRVEKDIKYILDNQNRILNTI